MMGKVVEQRANNERKKRRKCDEIYTYHLNGPRFLLFFWKVRDD